VEIPYRLFCPLKGSPPCCDSELDGFFCHIQDDPGIEGDNRFPFADLPDILYAVLEISDPRVGVMVKNISDILSGRDLSRATDAEYCLMGYQIP